MNDLVSRTISAHLRSQAGVISRGQAAAAGLSADAIDRRIARRRWRPLHPRVYLDSAHDYGDEARVRAAALWAGPDAVLSGLVAAWWHGLVDTPPTTVSLTVPRRRFPRAREGIAVRRRDLPASDRAVRSGLAVTAIPLTVLESAVELGESGARFLERALLGPAGFAETVEAYRRNRTAAGAAAARALLLDAARGSVAAGRRDLVALLRRARMIGWREGHPVAGFVLPLAFPAVRVAIEVEGWSWPAPVEQPAGLTRLAGTVGAAGTEGAAGIAGVDERRRWRRAVLLRAGWTVVRLTRGEIEAAPDVVLATIGAALARRRVG